MHRLFHSRTPLTALGLLLITLLAVLLAASSLSWQMSLDTPLLHYWAWLINEQQLAPYRDVFETSMPMTLLVHMGIGEVLGYDDLHIRIADLLILAMFCILSLRWLRRLNATVAWAATALFALVYLAHGSGMSLQRDYLAIIPIVAALGILPDTDHPVANTGWIKCGALLALAALIKPHALLAILPIVWVYRRPAPVPLKHLGRDTLWLLLGLAIPVLFCTLWLATTGGLGAFLEMTFGYLPLHNQLNGDSEALTGLARLEYLWVNFIHLGGYARWLGAGLFGVFYYLSCCQPKGYQQRQVTLVLGLIAVFAIYPVIAGKFWRYHYLPLLYFLIVGTSLLLAGPSSNSGSKLARRLPTLCFFLTILVSVKHLYLLPVQAVTNLTQSAAEQPATEGRVDALTDWLMNNVQAQESIQVLDWGGGALHAMLRARQPVATRFLYDYHFYHSQSEPLIHQLRAEFMDQLREASPTYIIENRRNQGVRPHGRDTTNTFAALRQFLSDNYYPLTTVRGYRIYQHIIQPGEQ
jgi:hypothetical protein